MSSLRQVVMVDSDFDIFNHILITMEDYNSKNMTKRVFFEKILLLSNTDLEKK